MSGAAAQTELNTTAHTSSKKTEEILLIDTCSSPVPLGRGKRKYWRLEPKTSPDPPINLADSIQKFHD